MKNLGSSHAFLIDASVYIFRAYFSLPSSLTDPEGNPINALYGFCRFIIEVLQKHKPQAIAVAFDESLTTSFRNEIYPDYKANRDQPPAELVNQLQLCREFVETMGIANYASPTYEADDIIGALAHKLHQQDRPVVVITRDKDLMQVLKRDDFYLDFAANKWVSCADVKSHLGVRAEQVAQFLALTGDAVDNIPGVPGIGKKTAAALLDAYSSIEDILENLDKLHELPIRGAKNLSVKLANHCDTIELALSLTKIPNCIDVELPLQSLVYSQPDRDGLKAFFKRLGMGKQMMNAIEKL